MDAVPFDADALVALIGTALAQSRIDVVALIATALPSLPSDRRTFPERVARKMERGNVYEKGFLHDVDALIDLVNDSLPAGTHRQKKREKLPASGAKNT